MRNHNKYAQCFKTFVLYGSNYWHQVYHTPLTWAGAKKMEVSKQNYICVGGKRARLTFIRKQY